MTRKEQKMAKALHLVSELDATISQLKDMLESEGEEVSDQLDLAKWELKESRNHLYKVISATGLHNALNH